MFPGASPDEKFRRSRVVSDRFFGQSHLMRQEVKLLNRAAVISHFLTTVFCRNLRNRSQFRSLQRSRFQNSAVSAIESPTLISVVYLFQCSKSIPIFQCQDELCHQEIKYKTKRNFCKKAICQIFFRSFSHILDETEQHQA